MEKKYNSDNRESYEYDDDYYEEIFGYDDKSYRDFKKVLSRTRKKNRANKLKKMNKRDRRDS